MRTDYEINIEKLDNLSIFQLREVGSRIGVRNPTALRTRELKQEIIDIVNGIKEPYKKEKSGRPHKSVIADSEWDNLVGFDTPTPIESKFTPTGIDALYSPMSSLNKRLSNKLLSGYVTEAYNELIFVQGSPDNLDLFKFAKINENTQGAGFLSPGDYIVCKIDFANDQPFVTQICSINGQLPEEYNFTEQSYSYTKGQNIDYTFSTDTSLSTGQRLLITSTDASKLKAQADDIALNLSKEYKIVYLSNMKYPEDRINLDNTEYFFTNFAVTPENLLFSFKIALERAKNLCANGNNVILVLDNINDIIKTFLQCQQILPNQTDLTQTLKSLCAMSISTDIGSITIILSALETTDKTEKEYLDMISQYFTQKVKI